jgi:hypothetical protein
MVFQTQSTIDERNQMLLGKVSWDVQLHLRKFVEVAEKAMTNDTWRQTLSHDTRQWIREWYPLVKEWLEELRQFEEYSLSNQRIDGEWQEMLNHKYNRPDFKYFVASASIKLGLEEVGDDIGWTMSRRMLCLSNIQRDIETRNYARLWLVDY